MSKANKKAAQDLGAVRVAPEAHEVILEELNLREKLEHEEANSDLDSESEEDSEGDEEEEGEGDGDDE